MLPVAADSRGAETRLSGARCDDVRAGLFFCATQAFIEADTRAALPSTPDLNLADLPVPHVSFARSPYDNPFRGAGAGSAHPSSGRAARATARRPGWREAHAGSAHRCSHGGPAGARVGIEGERQLHRVGGPLRPSVVGKPRPRTGPEVRRSAGRGHGTPSPGSDPRWAVRRGPRQRVAAAFVPPCGPQKGRETFTAPILHARGCDRC